MDITRDLRGNLSKKTVNDYLIKSLGYVMEGCNKRGNKVISENSSSIGKDCLTFIYSMDGIILRAKFYNKYVCQLTSAGVNYNMGNHFANLVDGENERLKKAFLDSREHGLTRMEVTLYSNKVYNKEYYSNVLEELEDISRQPSFYKTPFRNQWLQIENKLKNSLFLVDKTNGLYYYIYYVNNKTDKLIGISSKCVPSKHYIIREFSLKDLPVNVLVYSYNKECIEYNVESYVKVEGDKCISRTMTFNTRIGEDINFNSYKKATKVKKMLRS